MSKSSQWNKDLSCFLKEVLKKQLEVIMKVENVTVSTFPSRLDASLGVDLGQTPRARWKTSPQTLLSGSGPRTARRQSEPAPTWRTRCSPAWLEPSPSSPTSESPRYPRSSCSCSSLSPTPSSWRPADIGKLWGETL